jgi:hypothetical protein
MKHKELVTSGVPVISLSCRIANSFHNVIFETSKAFIIVSYICHGDADCMDHSISACEK